MSRTMDRVAAVICIITLALFKVDLVESRAMANLAPFLNDAEQINEVLSSFITKGDKVALLLDYDGTLSELAAHPDLATMQPDSEHALRHLEPNKDVYIAIISGRAAEDARSKVNLEAITYAGNHGFEIIFRNKTRYSHQVDEEHRTNFLKMVTALETNLGSHGAWVENKKHSLTFHYRDVAERDQEHYRRTAKQIIEQHGFLANQAHSAVEAKPPVVWNKGEAALYILREEFGENWPETVKVIFAGDDTTDEDAMKALKGAGLTFRVATRPEIETYADYRVPSTKSVSMILQWLQATMHQA